MIAQFYSRAYSGFQNRLRSFAGGRYADHCRPISICLLVTEQCNARCVHCDMWKNRARSDALTVGQWMKVLDDLRHWLGPVHIVFTGGEALIKSFTPELVAHASRIGLLAEVLTNGYWDDKKIERLIRANPWKITVSVDGIGDVHSKIRGHADFWGRTARCIDTIERLRREHNSKLTLRLKHVIMAQNLGESLRVAEYGNCEGIEVFFQPIEQNYNTPEDPEWFRHSENWPSDVERVISQIEQLIERKRRGWQIANSEAQLADMIPYFKDPARYRLSVQMHSALDRVRLCAALTTMQIQENGAVTVCFRTPPVGNVKTAAIRIIWEARPKLWRAGCCLAAERGLVVTT